MAGSASLDALRARAWNGPWHVLPERLADYPTMLTQEELRMLSWITSHHYTGRGAICDLGSFLGGSTAALAHGLALGGFDDAVVDSYDRHRANPKLWAEYVATRHDWERPAKGYLHLMPALLGEWYPRVRIHSGDFPTLPAPEGPIAILFIDIAKSPETQSRIMDEFFPALVPGHSLVIQQDYFHRWPAWDVATMEILRGHFELLSTTEENSALYLCTAAVDAAAVARVREVMADPVRLRAVLVAAGARWKQLRQRLPIYELIDVLDHFGEIPTRAEAWARYAARDPVDPARLLEWFGTGAAGAPAEG